MSLSSYIVAMFSLFIFHFELLFLFCLLFFPSLFKYCPVILFFCLKMLQEEAYKKKKKHISEDFAKLKYLDA